MGEKKETGKTKLKVNLELDDNELDSLWHAGVRMGYVREDGTKPWKKKEKKVAARFAIAKIVEGGITDEAKSL